MKKEYALVDNEIIIYYGTSKERNITEERNECAFCKYDRRNCEGNGKGVYCDMFTITTGWEELFIKN